MPRTVLAVADRIRRRARRGLRSAAGQGYRYDAQGRRVRSDVGGAQRRYSLYAQDGRLLWQRDEVAATRSVNVYLAGSLVAEVHRPLSGTTASVGFLHTDPLGSPIAKTDATGAVVETSEYEPYGLLLNRANDDRPGYTGHVMDSATGLTYMQQRYYDPQIGRFLSSDPVTAYAMPGSNFNRYWYANDNPYGFIDPDGRLAQGEGGRSAISNSPCGGGLNCEGHYEAGDAPPAYDKNADAKALFKWFGGPFLAGGAYLADGENWSALFEAAGLLPILKLGKGLALFEAMGEANAVARGTQFTRSSLQLGQKMHRAYKADLVNNVTRFKEFRFATGRRVDFIDFEKGIIYELKPNNPRAIREGGKQLEQYLKDAQAQFPGINWRTVLDTY